MGLANDIFVVTRLHLVSKFKRVQFQFNNNSVITNLKKFGRTHAKTCGNTHLRVYLHAACVARAFLVLPNFTRVSITRYRHRKYFHFFS